MQKIKTLDLFHTPTSMDEMQAWIDNARDPAVTTAAFMMYNFMADLHNKMVDEMEDTEHGTDLDQLTSQHAAGYGVESV